MCGSRPPRELSPLDRTGRVGRGRGAVTGGRGPVHDDDRTRVEGTPARSPATLRPVTDVLEGGADLEVGGGERTRVDLGSRRPATPTWSRRALLRFALSGVVAAVVVGLVSVVVSRRVGTDEAVADAARHAEVLAVTAIAPYVTDAFLAGDEDAMATMEWAMRDLVLRDAVEHATLWSPDGRVLWSDRSGEIGASVGPLDDVVTEALATGEVAAEVGYLERADGSEDRDAGRLLEVYRPLTLDDGRQVVFETYQSYDGVTDRAGSIWVAMLPATLVPLVLLQLIQIPLAARLGRQVDHSHRDQEELLRRAVEASDTERRQIARDLHDGVVQDLIGVSYTLSAAAEQADRRGECAVSSPLRDAAAQTRGAVQTMRSLSVEIYPANLERTGLEAAVRDLLAALDRRGIATTLHVDQPDGPPDIDTAAVLYRVTREAVRNVVRHARASAVTVDVSVTPLEASVAISDDGIGFDAPIDDTDGPPHLGLRLLVDHVDELGGDFEVRSSPGRGTTVSARVPR